MIGADHDIGQSKRAAVCRALHAGPGVDRHT
jgi:hypothetical protein